MSGSENSSNKPSRNITIPRRALPIIYVIGVGVAHVLLPWLISLVTTHYGWHDGQPNNVNLLALIPVILGMVGTVWGIVMHYLNTPNTSEWGYALNYLILKGPYRYSRNPMYVSEVLLWFGWAAFYGSISVLIAALIFWGFLAFYAVPHEEHALEARFGEMYLRYKHTVPRWIGKSKR